jgi:uncharacterized protein YceK
MHTGATISPSFTESSAMSRVLFALLIACALSGCAVVSVVDAAATVASTAVSVTSTVVGTAVDVTAAGVKAAVGSDSPAKP